jgi:hypothetical protein
MTRDEVAARVAHLVNRRVSAAELREALETPLSDEERNGTVALSRWFCRRYPTPLERLAYVRRAYRRWQRPGIVTRAPSDLDHHAQ